MTIYAALDVSDKRGQRQATMFPRVMYNIWHGGWRSRAFSVAMCALSVVFYVLMLVVSLGVQIWRCPTCG